MPTAPRSVLDRVQLWIALACLAVGQAFIFLRWRPVTDYYFILVWGGYILLVDHLVFRRSGRSLLRDAPLRFLAMFPASAVFWWVFEGYNQFVGNWKYLGSEDYQGLKYVLVASLFFSTVLPAVWETAELLLTKWRVTTGVWRGGGEATRAALAAVDGRDSGPGAGRNAHPIEDHRKAGGDARRIREHAFPLWLPAMGVVLAVLPLVWPRWAFPLVWIGLFVVLDPLNARSGRPSILAMLLRGEWRAPLAFYAAAIITGFFWEFWNFWAWPKWIYTLPPLVEWFPRLFEMPLPGYFGYGPFGWELYAMWHFVARAQGPGAMDQETQPLSGRRGDRADDALTVDRRGPTAGDERKGAGGETGRVTEVAGG